MTKYIRLLTMVASFLATVILHSVPDVAPAAEWGTLIATFVLAAWNAWKNNDFTFAAKVGSKVMHAIKDGKITEDEAKCMLEVIDEFDAEETDETAE